MTSEPARAPTPVDAALAVLACAAILVTTALAALPGDRPWWPGGAAFVVAGSLAIAWRRRAPVVVVGLTLATAAPYYWLDYPDGAIGALVAVAVYTAASRGTWRRAVLLGAVVLLLWVGVERLLVLRDGTPVPDPDHYVWIVVVVAIGIAVAGLRGARTAAAERADERTRRRVEQERLRIAREVHDVVSHSLSMIAVQAGVGAHVADRRPESAKAALLEIKQASSTALGDLRAVLAVLRTDGDTPSGPGLHRLPEVCRVAELAGLSVEVDGTASALPAAVDEAAFGVVREAVTNVVRHARAARRVTVGLHRRDGVLHVRVTDDGDPVAGLVPGQGLTGLAERAAALGGRSSVTPGAAGVTVEAELPIEPASVATGPAAS